MAYVPPWLSVTPQSFAESYANGVRAGLSAAAQRQQAAQAAARMAQVDAEERRREWETQQRLALDQQGLAQRKELGLENLRAQQAWRDASMGLDRERLAETGRHNLAVESKTGVMTPYEQEMIRQREKDRALKEREKTLGMTPATASQNLRSWDDFSKNIDDDQRKMDLMTASENAIRKSTGLPLLPRKVITSTTNTVPKIGLLDKVGSLITGKPAVPQMVDEVSTVTNSVPWTSVGLSIPQTQESAPQFKEGDKIRSKVDGKIYIVRNGEPVLMEGQ